MKIRQENRSVAQNSMLSPKHKFEKIVTYGTFAPSFHSMQMDHHTSFYHHPLHSQTKEQPISIQVKRIDLLTRGQQS